MPSVTCRATPSAAVTTAGPAAASPLRSTMITLSTCFYGPRMNLRSATCGRNHETWRPEAQPRWEPAEKPAARRCVWPAGRVSGMICVMQGFERMDGGLLDAVVGQLVPAGSMFAFLAAHRAEVFPDADYADLFAPPGVGRPSLPATRMAAVLTLQVLHDYSDRETAEAARFDVRWKA